MNTKPSLSLEELFETLTPDERRILTDPKKIPAIREFLCSMAKHEVKKNDTQKDFEVTYTTMQKLFGENFFGIEEVVRAFTIPSKASFAAHIAAEKEARKIKKMLHIKCNEPDMAFFLENIARGTSPADEWMMILHIPHLINHGTRHPITMEYTVNTMDKSLYKNGKGKLLTKDSRWAQSRYFYRSEKISNYRWDLLTKRCIDETYKKDTDKQERTLKSYAIQNGLNPSLVRTRKPLDILYAYFVALSSRNAKILLDEFDQAVCESSNENVYMGVSSLGGLKIHSAIPEYGKAHNTGRILAR